MAAGALGHTISSRYDTTFSQHSQLEKSSIHKSKSNKHVTKVARSMKVRRKQAARKQKEGKVFVTLTDLDGRKTKALCGHAQIVLERKMMVQVRKTRRDKGDNKKTSNIGLPMAFQYVSARDGMRNHFEQYKSPLSSECVLEHRQA